MKKLMLVLLTITLLAAGACGGSAATEGTFTEKDLVFVYEGTEYPLNSDAAPLLDVLGQDYALTTAPSCVYPQFGDDKMFEYDSIIVYTYPIEGKDMIDEIYFFGGDFATQKGIVIGSTLEEVTAQYGQGFDRGPTYEYVLSGDVEDLKSPRFTFEMTDGKVSGISYYSASNVVNDSH